MARKLFAPLVITLMILVLFPNTGMAASKSLSVENYSQEKSQWCWVTAGQIVIRYLSGTYYSQCTLYKAGKATTSCSANEPGGFYADTARVLQHGKVYVGYVGTGLPPMYTITDEIDKNQPMLARIGWKSDPSTGHMLVIRGYDTSGSNVRYVYPKQSSSYSDRTSEYRTSTWSYLKDNSSWELTHTRYQMN
ncbi:C39 family peptidase [Bacillus infantis]|uniref:C39 family peptidase n=1 Tax=Bacillus infantis TaxID=324767 RepID=UPI001CD797F5|nr:C39 family peptidase [Bacillus infantis]MCA1042029.1 C39 family peptidase [Bacillus infantis]